MIAGDRIKILNGHSYRVDGFFKFSKERIISCSDDFTLKLWNVAFDECLKTFTGHELINNVSCVKIFSNDKILSSSWNGTIKL